MDFNAIMELPAIRNTIAHAIHSGSAWGEEFLSDPKWQGNKDRMAHHAIYESTLWSVGQQFQIPNLTTVVPNAEDEAVFLERTRYESSTSELYRVAGIFAKSDCPS
jgi:hypothetical protein